MPQQWPTVTYKEEGMREGMQIEDANITVDDKIELLDMLSETGLSSIVVGSFVSPKWTPQMERIDEIVQRFTPKPGVTYSALALNSRGVERARAYSPPLTIERDKYPRLSCHLCDVFARRNTNRTQMQEMERWPEIIAQAQEVGIRESGIGCNASWGSNFLGEFPVDSLMTLLEYQHGLWDEAGINVVSCSMGDPMSHCTPAKVEESVTRVKERWPEINHFRLHLHNGRNMAIASAYAAMRVLGPEDTLELDGTIGGFGGCPYCGNGRATGMAPTEDLLHMMDDMGIPNGRGHRQAHRLRLGRRADHRSGAVRPRFQSRPATSHRRQTLRHQYAFRRNHGPGPAFQEGLRGLRRRHLPLSRAHHQPLPRPDRSGLAPIRNRSQRVPLEPGLAAQSRQLNPNGKAVATCKGRVN